MEQEQQTPACTGGPGPAYDLLRSDAIGSGGTSADDPYQDLRGAQSVDYSEATMSTGADGASGAAPGPGGGVSSSHDQHQHRHQHHPSTPGCVAGGIGSRLPEDSTETVHEMHLALLYLLSDPGEFARAVSCRKDGGGNHAGAGAGANLEDWNASYDREDADAATDITGSGGGGGHSSPPPLPYAVFADDAEVVLPQAHTANQLFGLEREGGIELEAAAGIPALSQLFLRWLALMPDGDHMNIIDPPGLTVMRIAGGRYRCTAAHRVVWTWNSEFPPELFRSPNKDGSPAALSPMDELHMGDLVTMTIVDVFETDTDGKLLSYCPTFDNRAIRKTMKTAEQIRKGSSKVKAAAKAVARSQTAARFHDAASLMTRMSIKAAAQVKDTVVKKIDDEMHKASAKPSSPEGEEATVDQNAEESDVATGFAQDKEGSTDTDGTGTGGSR